MTREEADQLAAYGSSPRHVVRYRNLVVSAVDGDHIEFHDGSRMFLSGCDASHISVCEIFGVDWKKALSRDDKVAVAGAPSPAEYDYDALPRALEAMCDELGRSR